MLFWPKSKISVSGSKSNGISNKFLFLQLTCIVCLEPGMVEHLQGVGQRAEALWMVRHPRTMAVDVSLVFSPIADSFTPCSLY